MFLVALNMTFTCIVHASQSGSLWFPVGMWVKAELCVFLLAFLPFFSNWVSKKVLLEVTKNYIANMLPTPLQPPAFNDALILSLVSRVMHTRTCWNAYWLEDQKCLPIFKSLKMVGLHTQDCAGLAGSEPFGVFYLGFFCVPLMQWRTRLSIVFQVKKWLTQTCILKCDAPYPHEKKLK